MDARAMNGQRHIVGVMMVTLSLLLSGCAGMFQDPHVSLIREPGYRTYNPPEPVSHSARALWEYAVLSENAYVDQWGEPGLTPAEQTARVSRVPPATPEAYVSACRPDHGGRLPLPGWTMWSNFPSASLREKAREVGLYVEVWERNASPPVVAVVFRGTEAASWKDWVSNFRWFLRFVPLYPDQYTVVARDVGNEVLADLKRKIEGGREHYKAVQIVTTGHSLGGGLAQHLAYALPPVTTAGGTVLPRVSNVYGFDPSPVTGWYSVSRTLRTANAEGLKIDRVFEHGEVLAYLRLILRYLNPPSARDPSIREIRYNFVDSINPFSSHSMRLIACSLIDASGQATIPAVGEKFQTR